MRRTLLILTGLVGLVAGLILLLALRTEPRPPVLVVSFQGNTNMHDGAKGVVLSLSNATARAVDRQSNYEIVRRNGDQYSSTPGSLPMNHLFSAGEVETVVVPVPEGSGAWSTMFFFRHVPDPLDLKFIWLKQKAESLGLPIRHRDFEYPVESGWMER